VALLIGALAVSADLPVEAAAGGRRHQPSSDQVCAFHRDRFAASIDAMTQLALAGDTAGAGGRADVELLARLLRVEAKRIRRGAGRRLVSKADARALLGDVRAAGRVAHTLRHRRGGDVATARARRPRLP
jgi:hypothetical protein